MKWFTDMDSTDKVTVIFVVIVFTPIIILAIGQAVSLVVCSMVPPQ